jgi:hypothetical protein
MAFGMAAVVTPLTTVVMNSAPDAQSGTASGINNAASRIAGLVAVAALGAVASLVFDWQGAPAGARFSDLPAIGDAARGTTEAAFVAAYSSAMLLASLLAALAAGAAFLWLRENECVPERAAAAPRRRGPLD